MNVNDNNGLDWFSEGPSQHVVFGHIVKGMELAVAVSEVCKAPPRLACAVVPCPPTLSHTHSRCVLTSRALAGQDGQRLPHRAHPSGLGDHLQPVSWRLCAATALGGEATPCPSLPPMPGRQADACEKLSACSTGLLAGTASVRDKT